MATYTYLNVLSLLLLCLFAFPKTGESGAVQAECPHGWLHFQTSCFHFSTTSLSWYDAESSCRAHNARLAEVYTREVAMYLRNTSMHYSHEDYWLGGRDDVTEGTWQWASTGKTFTVTDWAPGQPDDFQSAQDCLRIYSSRNYHWDDAHCEYKHRYICESIYPGEEIVG